VRQRKTLVGLLIAVFVVSLLAGGCGRQAAETPGPGTDGEATTPEAPAEKVFIFARGSDSVSLDPTLITDGESAKVCDNIYDGLVRYKEGSTEIEPALAESWDVSDDGLVWTFTLRQGVKFHDGTDFNAAAVVYNIERQMPPQRTSDMSYSDFTLGMIDKAEALDEHTLRLTLKYPYAPFLANLAMGISAPICSPTALEELGADYGDHPCGTGPFIFERWDKDQQIVLVANEDYWDGAPKVDKLVFKVTKENAVRANELLAGEVDMIDGIDPNDVARLEASDAVGVAKGPGMNINYLGLRCHKPPFDDLRVRKAASMAIDRESLVQYLYQGNSMVANGPLPPGLFGYVSGLKPYAYDPDQAKALLAEAGYDDDVTIELRSYPNPRAYNPVGGDRLAEALQADLEKVGFKVNIVSKAWKEHLDAVDADEGECFLLGWMGDNGDPDNFLYMLLHTDMIDDFMNSANYSNPEVDDLLFQAQQEFDANERLNLYKQAQEKIVADAPWVFIGHGLDMVGMGADVTGFTLHPASRIYLRNVDK